MFSWSIAKSAEAMLTRWTIKRVCKFLLKKKLGKFILGDIDPSQLDVQLSAGTIQLSDLALNVDYINEKLGTAPILVKEGSIGSLVVTMPWKEGGCRIEVDELEIVLSPHRANVSDDEFETTSPDKTSNSNFTPGLRNINSEAMNSRVANASVDVHEGVKTVAKMVKGLLSSFHVKIKKLIVAFDTLADKESKKALDRILVLRIGEIECGTHIAEDGSPSSFATAHNFLSLSRLTTFVKFQGAVLELLNVDGIDSQLPPDLTPETTLGNWYSGYCSSGNMTMIVAGETEGFSGNLKLSIPWKNGSLDISRVEADLHIEPLELRIQPSTIRYLISMFNLFKSISEKLEDQDHHGVFNGSSAPVSCMLSGREHLGKEVSVTSCSLMEKEAVDFLLSESHLISDWASKIQKDRNEEEPDFGASVDQFFECFDELRNSQSALGNSGMWNWTCSVFSAITAASNLASGSLNVPIEQQHVETKFNATIVKASFLVFFIDEDQEKSPKEKGDKANLDVYAHCLCAQFVDLLIELQVRPQEINVDATVQHVQLVDHLHPRIESVHTGEHGWAGSDISVIWKMQDGVEGAVRALQEPNKDPDCQVNYSIDVSLNAHEVNRCCHMTSVKDFCWKQASVTLLKTSGVSRCHVTVKSGSFGTSSLSLKLPPLICWVNFDLITMVVEFLDQMGNSFDSNRADSGFAHKSETKGYGLPLSIDQEKNLHREATTSTAKFSLESVIFLPNARIILCFPLKEHREYNSYSSCDQFVAFDLISPTVGGKNVRPSRPIPSSSSNKGQTGAASCSLHLNLGDFYLYSISAAFTEKIIGRRIYSGDESSFSAEKIISVANGAGDLSLISMFWQDGPVTGPWIAKKAKLLVSSEIARSKDKVVGKGCEFASVTTIKDTADFEARTRQEILSTSSFLIHAQIPPICINLGKFQYESLCGLVDQLFEHLRDIGPSSSRSREERSALQASVLVECSSVTMSVDIEPASDPIGSMFKELPGSWVNLTLQVNKFELLSASDIGGIRNFNLFWLTHGQGSLWGSITESLRKFLLISCNDSVMGRGDGEGSNVLSSRNSGSNIVNLWDAESNHNFTSITVKCPTIVATGGRVDWCNAIVSFFSRSSSDFEEPNNDGSERASGSSFSLILVDVGLSYEPYFNKLANNEGLHPESYDPTASGSRGELEVAGLLTAASLKLFNTTGIGCMEGEYKIKLQDLGLLIRGVSESELVGSIYSVEHLKKIGYVKVAEEAHVEACLKTNCDNGLVWELECAESHITLSTCHDTTFGLIKLASQLQNLFAPDMQDYAEHLENRWKNAQQINDDSYYKDFSNEVSPSVTHTQSSSLDKGSKVSSWMDEVCENVFQLDENSGLQHSLSNSRRKALGSESYLSSSRASSSGESLPEFIEEYFLSDLRPLSELVFRSQPSDVLCNKSHSGGEAAQIGSGGWYGDNSLQILENHASKVDYRSNIRKLVVKEPSTSSTSNSDHVDGGKAVGCILLKNMNVIWRMYGGNDWPKFHNNSQAAATFYGRDTSACLELEFSGIEVKYDAYPDGQIFASKLSVTIQDFFLNDKSDSAPWKLVLGYHQSMKHPRMFSAKAVKLNLEIVKPDPSLPLEENRLRISLLPIRLHLHQSQLDFLISFFGGKDSPTDPSHGNIPMVLEKSGVLSDTSGTEAFLPYFQKFDISPMSIRVDYSPSHVDLTALRSGKYVELVNLVPWKGVEIQLKHVHGVGLYGWDSVFEAILGEWVEDISQNQIHKLLKGLAPIKSLVAVGSGAAKLVSLPVKSYKKDRRLLKGMQRGTVAFLRSISLEAIGLGVHLAAGAHDVLLQAEYILTTIPPSVPWPAENRVASNVRSNQPKDAQQGIQQACQSISDGLGKSASALLQTPLKRYQRGAGVGSALATAVQSAPAAAIAPASAAARAVHCALLGIRNSLDPERRKESVEKYLGRSPPRESMQ